MSDYEIRNLNTGDFEHIRTLETEIFGAMDEGLLCPYYVRLCCDFFPDNSFIAFDGGRPIAYLLCFVKGREAYCTTLAIRPEYQRTRLVVQLLKAFVSTVVQACDVCWFTVDEDNKAARALHRMLGATEVEVRQDFYGAGDHRIVSRIDRERFEEQRRKYVRLGLLDKEAPVAREAA